jgi:hypothetical protein
MRKAISPGNLSESGALVVMILQGIGFGAHDTLLRVVGRMSCSRPRSNVSTKVSATAEYRRTPKR